MILTVACWDAPRLRMANITVVGITDAGAASLLPEAQAAVAEARLLCGGERHLAFFPEHAAERVIIKGGLEQLYLRLEREERLTVVLASGDPDWYGIGPLLAERLGQKRVRILPNLSAVQLACARLGIAWQDAVFLSAHGRSLEGILPQALYAPKAVVLTDNANTPAAIAQALLDAGDTNTRADVFEHLGGPKERHVSCLAAEMVNQEFAPLNLLVLTRTAKWRLPLGLPDDLFAHQRGQITKAEVRAVSVSKLALHADAVVWDIGAGCGSVSIEVAGLASCGHVYAVERNAEQQDYLALNQRRFGAGNVTIVTGEAPDALAGLPEPDAVFIGGSGGHLDEVLNATTRALKPGGRVVLNLVGLEHVSRAFERLQTDGWSPEVTQLSVARSTSTAGITRLAALNPVFVIAAHKR